MMRRIATLVALATVLVACGTDASEGDSGIFGRVLAGPQCPVVSEESPCPDAPVATTVRVETLEGEPVTTFESGSDGRFRVALGPGTYRLVVDPEGIRFAKPVDVTVPPGRYVRADVFLDTGIR